MRCKYREKKIFCGEICEVEIYPVFEQPRCRKNKYRPSREAQKKLNEKNKKKKLRRMLNANFCEKDIEIHLTYRDGDQPEDYEMAIKNARNYIRRVRRLYKAEKIEMKYIIVTEQGKNKRWHHHITISGGIDRDTLEGMWGKGRANSRRLQPDENGFAALANYIAKESTGKRGWIGSKNLKKPKETKNDNKISKRTAGKIAKMSREEIERLYKGFEFVKIDEADNEINGGIYVNIILRRKHCSIRRS